MVVEFISCSKSAAKQFCTTGIHSHSHSLEDLGNYLWLYFWFDYSKVHVLGFRFIPPALPPSIVRRLGSALPCSARYLAAFAQSSTSTMPQFSCNLFLHKLTKIQKLYISTQIRVSNKQKIMSSLSYNSLPNSWSHVVQEYSNEWPIHFSRNSGSICNYSSRLDRHSSR